MIFENSSAIIPITLEANTGDGDEDHHDGGDFASSHVEYSAVVEKNSVWVGTLPVAVSKAAGTGTVSLVTAKAEELFASASGAVITMPSIPGVKAITLELPRIF
jgi:hypothetical protein